PPFAPARADRRGATSRVSGTIRIRVRGRNRSLSASFTPCRVCLLLPQYGTSISGLAASGPPRRGARTGQITGSNPDIADVNRVWSSLPYVRPLVRVYPDGQAC